MLDKHLVWSTAFAIRLNKLETTAQDLTPADQEHDEAEAEEFADRVVKAVERKFAASP